MGKNHSRIYKPYYLEQEQTVVSRITSACCFHGSVCVACWMMFKGCVFLQPATLQLFTLFLQQNSEKETKWPSHSETSRWVYFLLTLSLTVSKKKKQAFCTNAFTSEYFATSKGNFYELEFMKNKLQVEGRDVSVKQHFRNCTFSEGGNYVFFTPWFLSFVSVTLELKENWKCWQTWTRWMWNVSPCFCITLLLIFLWFFSRYLWRCQIFLNLCEWQN